MHLLAIGEVAKRAGVRASAIRYYESEGLLPAAQREQGQRRYDESIFQRLAIIHLAQEVGFSITEVRDLVGGIDHQGVTAERWRAAASRKLDDVQAHIERAHQMRQVLEDSLRCDCLTLDACPLVVDRT